MVNVPTDLNLPAEDRIIALRARQDLQIEADVFQGNACWVIKDPIKMKYYRLQPPEYAIWKRLNGTSSYRQILDSLEREFPELLFQISTIQHFVASMHSNDLLLSPANGLTRPRVVRKWKERKQKMMAALMQPYIIRFPGFDPSPILKIVYPLTGWLFSKVAFFGVVFLVFSASLLVLSNWIEFQSRLPDFQSFFSFENLLKMGVVLMFTKTIHEFGHAVCCRRFGGECHEIGFMFLVMTPALYCDTSDSWAMPKKWQRIAIGGAGMYVELLMAAIATFVWWNSLPGMVHFTALNVMFLCSTSTLIFNGNPLLRYDGYYMLADWLEIPNLSQRSNKVMLDRLRVWCLGLKPSATAQLPQRHRTGFIAYSIAAFFYRWFITFSILWFVIKIAEPLGLGSIAYSLITVTLCSMLGVPLFKLYKFLTYPGRRREMKTVRITISLLLLGGVLWFICLIPVVHDVEASFVIRPADAEKVYVTSAGTLVDCPVNVGDEVAAGTLLGRLENDELRLSMQQLTGQRTVLQRQLETLELKVRRDVELSRLVVESRAEMANLEQQILATQKLINQLTLISSRGGTVLPAPNIPKGAYSDVSLQRWTGTPLEKHNQGCFLERQTLFCQIGDPTRLEVRLFVDQSDVALLAPGQPVQIKPKSYPDARLMTSIESVSGNEIEAVPRELSQTNGGPIAVKPFQGPDQVGIEKSLMKTYEAKALLRISDEQMLLIGMQGKARIRVGTATLGWRAYRYLQTVFNFR